MSGGHPADDAVRARALDALAEVVDPEIGLDIVSLGLVYGVDVDAGRIAVRLTMTTPACPLGEHIAREAERKLRSLAGVVEATVELVWDPPWTAERMTPEARQALGWSG